MVPLIGAMPWLATAITTILVWFANFFISFLGKKLGVVAAITASYIILTTAFIVATKLLISTITATIPAWLETGAHMVPTNVSLCFGVMMGAKIYRWIYDYKYRMLTFLI